MTRIFLFCLWAAVLLVGKADEASNNLEAHSLRGQSGEETARDLGGNNNNYGGQWSSGGGGGHKPAPKVKPPSKPHPKKSKGKGKPIAKKGKSTKDAGKGKDKGKPIAKKGIANKWGDSGGSGGGGSGSGSGSGGSGSGYGYNSQWAGDYYGKWSFAPTSSPTMGSTSQCKCNKFSDQLCANCFQGTGYCPDKVCAEECCEVKTCDCSKFTSYTCSVCAGDRKGTCPDDLCASVCCDSNGGSSYGSYRNATRSIGNYTSHYQKNNTKYNRTSSSSHSSYNNHNYNHNSNYNHSSSTKPQSSWAWASANSSNGSGSSNSNLTMYIGLAMMVGTVIAAVAFISHNQGRRTPSPTSTVSGAPLAKENRENSAPPPRNMAQPARPRQSQHSDSPSVETSGSFYGA